MRRSLVSAWVVLGMMFGSMSVGAEDAKITATWDPPTHKVANMDCGQTGQALTPEDLARVEYTVEYRVVGSPNWIPIDTLATSIVLSGLAYETQYEVRVGAHWPDGTVLCPTEPSVLLTSIEPPPAACGTVQLQQTQ